MFEYKYEQWILWHFNFPCSHLLHLCSILKSQQPRNYSSYENHQTSSSGGSRMELELPPPNPPAIAPSPESYHYVTCLAAPWKCPILEACLHMTWLREHSVQTSVSLGHLSKKQLASLWCETVVKIRSWPEYLKRKIWGSKMSVGGWQFLLTRKPHTYAELCAWPRNIWGGLNFSPLADFEALCRLEVKEEAEL